MKLAELAEIFDAKVEYGDVVTSLHKYWASLSRCEIVVGEGGVLASPTGFGKTKAEARKALAERLAGATIRIDRTLSKQFYVPQTIRA